MKFEKRSMENLMRMDVPEFKESKKNPVILVLDNIRSAHNIGSIFRTADAFRVEAIYLTGICAVPPQKELMKTSLGAEATVHWKYFETISEAMEDLKKNQYFIAAVEQTTNSVSLPDFSPGEKTAFVFGNEVNGVSEDALALCDACIEIPQFGTKHSFNVSITTGIVLWDMYVKGIKMSEP